MSHEPISESQPQPQPKKKTQPAPEMKADTAQIGEIHADRIYVSKAIVLTPEDAPRKPGVWNGIKRLARWCAGRGANGYLKGLAIVNGTFTLRANLRGGGGSAPPKGNDLD